MHISLIILGVIVAAIVIVGLMMLPDFIRYMKIRSM